MTPAMAKAFAAADRSSFRVYDMPSAESGDLGNQKKVIASGASACVADKSAVRGVTRSHVAKLFVLSGLLLAAAVIFGTGFILSNLRDHALAERQRELQNVVLVLAEQTDRAFQAVELIESNLIERLQIIGVDSAEDYERKMSGHDIHLMLKEKVSGWPHIGSITLINSQGKLFNFSRTWPLPNIVSVRPTTPLIF
jgi:hypothetical protein